MFRQISEEDWKLFREKLPLWQEAYIDKLNQGYIKILTSSESSSERFWRLEAKINSDKRKTGVICDMRRSKMTENILSLIRENVIGIEDLCDFSDDLKTTIEHILEIFE